MDKTPPWQTTGLRAAGATITTVVVLFVAIASDPVALPQSAEGAYSVSVACQSEAVVCELERVASALAPGWSWPQFWQTLISTLVGAAAALVGSWWLARRETQHSEARDLDRSLAGALHAIVAYADAWRAYTVADTEWSYKANWEAPKPASPSTNSVLIAMDAAALAARGKARGIVYDAREVLEIIVRPETSWREDYLTKLTRIITRWRSGSLEDPHAELRDLKERATKNPEERDKTLLR